MSAPDDRWPRSVYHRGTEPDPRFSLANERTFLAWVRTAVAAGVLVGAARARRLTRGRDGEPEMSMLRDGRLPGVVASILAVLALGELASGVARVG